MSTEILCIGAAHMDRKAYAMSKIQLYTSIPVCIESSPGGVARNVAENLARLGHSVTLLSRVGKDREGERVIDTLNRIKIKWLESIYSAEHHTASYTALFTPEGELFLALAEMDIYDELDVPFFTTHLETMVRKPVWFLDTNLPRESIHFLVQLARVHDITLFVDPVSVPKAEKLTGSLKGIDFLFPNKDEAEVLSGVPIDSLEDADRAGKKIAGFGVEHVLITLGKDGVYWVHQDKGRHFPGLEAFVLDVTGAGDAFVSGFMHGWLHAGTVEEAVDFGQAAACVTLATTAAVYPEMCHQKLLELTELP